MDEVFISVSKIQFESKSQLDRKEGAQIARCLSVCQRYNLKANHNWWLFLIVSKSGVYQCVKDTIWKQITTERAGHGTLKLVFISVSKIQFESKSQPCREARPEIRRCLSVCQRYNLKANHNSANKGPGSVNGVYQCVKDTIWKQITTTTLQSFPLRMVFISVSKIQFESKSQQSGILLLLS